MDVEVPPELLEGVIRHLDPVEVWLFGSRARGDARPDSDWDLYVVVDDGTEARARAETAYAKHAFGGRADLLVTPWTTALARRRAFGTLEDTIDHEGRRIYAREEMPPLPPQLPEISTPAEWLDRGREDLRAARLMLANEFIGAAALQAQQAWEKALKGRLAAERIRVPKSHDLAELAGWLGVVDREELARLSTVTTWSISGRYGRHGETDIATIEAELVRAEAALDRLEAALRAT